MDIDNGHAAVVAALEARQTTVTVSPSEVRRLVKLSARAEGAAQVAQAAVNAAQAAQQALAVAVQEMCADEGINVPPDATADINWKTGEITITPPAGPNTDPPPPGTPPPTIIGPGVTPALASAEPVPN